MHAATIYDWSEEEHMRIASQGLSGLLSGARMGALEKCSGASRCWHVEVGSRTHRINMFESTDYCDCDTEIQYRDTVVHSSI
jgi:hypothetical protein